MPPYLLLGLLIVLGIIIWRRMQTSSGFAAGALQFFGASGENIPSHISYPNNADYYPGTGSFTVETWIKMNPLRVDGLSDNYMPYVFSLSGEDGSGGGYRILACKIQGDTIERELQVLVNNLNFAVCSFPVDNKWHHLAIVGTSGTNISVYIDGVRTVTETGSYDIVAGSYVDKHFNIGWYPEDDFTNWSGLIGYLSNFNYNPSTALYSGATLTVPTESPTAIASTKMLLLAVDEATKFTDSSSLNATGTASGLVLPTWSSQSIGVGA